MSSPDDPSRTSARNRGSPVVESVSKCAIRDCPDLAERVSASRLASRAKARYAAWNAPWCAADSSGPVRNTGFSEEALLEASTADRRRYRLEIALQCDPRQGADSERNMRKVLQIKAAQRAEPVDLWQLTVGTICELGQG